MKNNFKSIILITFQLVTSSSLFIIPFIYREFERDSLFTILLGLIFFIIVSLLFKNLSMKTMLNTKITRFIFIFYLIYNLILSKIYHFEVLTSMYYTKTPLIVIVIFLMLFCMLLYYVKKNILYSMELILVLLCLIPIILILLSGPEINIRLKFTLGNNILPSTLYLTLAFDLIFYQIFFNEEPLCFNQKSKLTIVILVMLIISILCIDDLKILPKVFYQDYFPNLFKFRMTKNLQHLHFDTIFLITLFIGQIFKICYFIKGIRIMLKIKANNSAFLIIYPIIFLGAYLLFILSNNIDSTIYFFTTGYEIILLILGGFLLAGIFKYNKTKR